MPGHFNPGYGGGAPGGGGAGAGRQIYVANVCSTPVCVYVMDKC